MTEQQTKAVELKPCPFCGSSNVYESSNGLDSHFLNCLDCGSEGPACKDVVSAGAAWNQRTQPLDPSMGGEDNQAIALLQEASDVFSVNVEELQPNGWLARVKRFLDAQPQPKTKGEEG
jgi:Lar family restriction alleviation protein